MKGAFPLTKLNSLQANDNSLVYVFEKITCLKIPKNMGVNQFSLEETHPKSLTQTKFLIDLFLFKLTDTYIPIPKEQVLEKIYTEPQKKIIEHGIYSKYLSTNMNLCITK